MKNSAEFQDDQSFHVCGLTSLKHQDEDPFVLSLWRGEIIWDSIDKETNNTMNQPTYQTNQTSKLLESLN